MTDCLEHLDTFRKDYIAIRRDFCQKGERELKKTFSAFFEQHPEIKSIYWLQYTPYFNDGDACVFTVYDVCASTVDDEDVEFYESNLNGASDEAKVDLAKLEGCMKDMEDILEDIFGDHCAVVARPTGFTVTEWDHE